MDQDSVSGGCRSPPPTDDIDEDSWDNDDFQPILEQTIKTIHTLSTVPETMSSITRPETTELELDIEAIDLHQSSTLHEVEVKYPSGIIPRVDVKAFRNSSGGKTSHTGTRIIQGQTIQGSHKYMSKTVLVDEVLQTLTKIWKQPGYIELSYKWNTSETQILGLIKKKSTFKFNEYSFNISKTLEELEKTKTYILTKRTPSEKILITVNKTTVDDLLYTLYKSIIYCINDSIPAFKSNMIDIFVLLSFLKLLRNRDEITLNYLSANF
jgi:hypothetical protein